MPFDISPKPVNVQLYFNRHLEYNDLIEWPIHMKLPEIGDEVEYCGKTMIVGRKVFNIDNRTIELIEKDEIDHG